MSRYDGLIIPRSYSEYINKTDAATLLQALQLSGVMDNAPTSGSNHPTQSGGVFAALAGKQAALTFDNVPTSGSNNPVKSSGVYTAVEKCIKRYVRDFAGNTVNEFLANLCAWLRDNLGDRQQAAITGSWSSHYHYSAFCGRFSDDLYVFAQISQGMYYAYYIYGVDVYVYQISATSI